MTRFHVWKGILTNLNYATKINYVCELQKMTHQGDENE